MGTRLDVGHTLKRDFDANLIALRVWRGEAGGQLGRLSRYGPAALSLCRAAVGGAPMPLAMSSSSEGRASGEVM